MNTSTRWIMWIIIVLVIIGGIVFFVKRTPPAGQPGGPTGTTLTSTSTAISPSNTYGMAEYTDPTYGFSFWYPSALAPTVTETTDSASFPGGTAVETIQIGPAGGTSVTVVNSPTSSITDEPNQHASPIGQTKYFYDTTTAQWMVAYPQGPNGLTDAMATSTADVSKTTISGLVMLPSGKRFDTTIIPLNTTQFLVISDGGGSSFTSQLAQTVTQAGASIDLSTEEAALQAEATAYARQ